MSTLDQQIPPNVVLRSATSDDARRLWRLAALDSSPLPTAPLLVAEVDGEILAAYSLSERRAIADPFQATAHLVEMLAIRGASFDGDGVRAGHSQRRFRGTALRSA